MPTLLRKVIAWRLVSISITLLVVWAATGNIRAASWITLLLHVVLSIAHLVFEAAWETNGGKQ